MGKLILLIFTFCSLIGAYSQEAAFDWAVSMGSSNLDRVKDIAVDDLGNTYITGNFQYPIDFDPGDGISELTPVSNDTYIAKYNTLGELLWCKSIGGLNLCAVYSICVEGGFIYLTGSFRETIDFDPGPGVFELVSGVNSDIYVLKLDVDGGFVWANRNGDVSGDVGRAITVDEADNIYVVGYYEGTVDFDPGVGVFDITAVGDRDIFIQKLNSEGNLVWVKSFGGSAEERVWSVEVDASSNVYVGGNYEGTCDFDPGDGVFPYTSSGFFDHYILKLDEDGDFIWAVTFGGTSGDVFEEMDVDSDGNVYSTGFFSISMDIEPGPGITEFVSSGLNDFFIQKLDTDGNLIWAKQVGGTEQDVGYDLKLDESNNIYTIGFFAGTVDFDPNAGISNFTSAGSVDAFVQKLDQDGNFIWAKVVGEAAIDEGKSIDVNDEGDVFLTGEFELTVDFDPGMGEFELESNGDLDIFILKLKACSPSATTNEITACISHTWIDGETYYESNNTATHTLTNIEGCDSVITLDLTINEVDITTSAVGGTITSNATGATYQWLDCNDGYSEIVGETGASFTPVEDGVYAVEVTTEECVDTSGCVSIDGVGISKNNLDMISVYPNPGQGTVCIKGLETDSYHLTIFSITGETVLQQSISGQEFAELELPQGQYILTLVGNDQIRHIKVIITG